MMFLMTTTTMVQTSPLSSDENQSTSAQTMSRQRVVSFDYHDHPDEARPSRSIAASWSSDDDDETILLQGVQTLDSRPLQMQMSWDEDDDLRRNVRAPFRDISNRRASNANNIFRAH